MARKEGSSYVKCCRFPAQFLYYGSQSLWIHSVFAQCNQDGEAFLVKSTVKQFRHLEGDCAQRGRVRRAF